MEIALLAALLATATLSGPKLPLIHVAANNLLVPLCAGALAWRARSFAPVALSIHRTLLVTTAALYLWTWVSAFLGDAPALSSRYAAKYGVHVLVFVCLLVAMRRRGMVRSALRTAYVALAILATLGVVEYWVPDPFDDWRGRLSVFPRVASLLVWPNQLGVLTAIAIALGAALWRAGWLAGRAFAIALPALIVALALTGSRNGWFVCASLLTALACWRLLSPLHATAIGAALVVALISFPVSTAQLGLERGEYLPLASWFTEAPTPLQSMTTPRQTLTPRLALWKAALGEIRQHPVSGVGLEVFATRIGPAIVGQHWINTHNLVLNIGAELGLVGLALFALWLIVFARAGDRRDPATVLPLLGLGLGQLFDCFTYDYMIMTCTALFAACYASRARAPV